MRIAITIQHPAHVHFFRHSIKELTEDGHDIRVFVREKSVALDLLDRYKIPFTLLCRSHSSFPGLIKTQFLYEAKLLREVRAFKPDVLAAIGGAAVAHVSALTSAKSIVFTDTEHASFYNKLTFPFANTLCLPTTYAEQPSREAVRYPGLHELAYLHPDRFEPDRGSLVQAGIDPDDRLVTLRLSAWQAMHDVGQSGITELKSIVNRIEALGATPILTAEGSVPDQLERYSVSLHPADIHNLLYFSNLYVGEGATMAAESAVLGTPSVYTSTLRLGYLDELAVSYGLVRQTDEPKQIMKAVSDLLQRDKREFESRREKLLTDKIDTTKFVLNQIKQLSENS